MLITTTLILGVLIFSVLVTGGQNIKMGSISLRFEGFTNLAIEFLLSLFLLMVLFKKRIRQRLNEFRRGFSALGKNERAAFLMLFLIFLYFWWWGFSYPTTIGGDGIGYYSYLRSIVMDGDLRFGNEFEKLNGAKFGFLLPANRTAMGYWSNPFSIGPAILWSPFFLLAFAISWLANSLGAHLPLDGYSPLFVLFTAAGTKIYGFLGLWFIYRGLRLFYKRSISFLSTVLILIATPVAFYLPFEPFMSHMHSLFSISAMVYYLLSNLGRRIRTTRVWIILGGLTGLIGLSRWQDLTFAFIPLTFLFLNQSALVNDKVAGLKKSAYLAGIYLLSLFAVVLPQLLVFKILYGFWVGVPQGNGFVTLTPTHLWDILFSPFHGLFQWHPILFISLIGLIWGSMKRQRLMAALLIAFLIQWFFNASLPQWWAGDSFGMRRLINCTLPFAFGLAFLIGMPGRKEMSGKVLVGLCGCLSIINLLAIKGYITGLVPHESSFSFIRILGTLVSLIKDNFFGGQFKNLLLIAMLAGGITFAKRSFFRGHQYLDALKSTAANPRT